MNPYREMPPTSWWTVEATTVRRYPSGIPRYTMGNTCIMKARDESHATAQMIDSLETAGWALDDVSDVAARLIKSNG